VTGLQVVVKTSAHAATVCVGSAPSTTSALTAAKACGGRVEDSSRRSVTGQVFANPDGTFTAEENAVPVRAKRADGSWAPIDLTLRANPDGSVSPTVTAVPLTLSGGGTADLATVSLSLTQERFTLGWPAALPKPTLSGDTATYANVLPDVDLKVRAQRDGFSQVFVVKTRDAAKNPALQKIKFTTSTTGASVAAAGPTGMTVSDRSGRPTFHVDAPAMWDSTLATLPDPGTGDRAGSDTTGPGRGAKKAAMTVQTAGNDLYVIPDPGLLGTADLNMPLYIDPSVTASRWHWTMINGYYIDQSYWSYDRNQNAKVGYIVDNGTQLYRSVWDFGTDQWRGTHVLSATFSATLLHSYSCSNSNTELHLTNAIDPNTTWRNHVNTWGGALANASNSNCNDVAGGVYTAWNGGGVNNAAAQSAGWPTITLGLMETNETSNAAWKKFDELTPKLAVTFNSYPNIPDTLTIDGKACGTGTKKAYVSTLGGHNPVLKARLSDPDAADHLTGNFSWATSTGTSAASQSNIANGQYAQVTTTATAFTPGTTYSFSVSASDGIDTSSTAGPCEFVVDNTAPDKAPSVTSADDRYGLPKCDGSGAWCDGVGKTGTFTLGPNGVADVASYLYSLGTSPPTTSAPAATVGGSATASVTPTNAGVNDLFVRSVDQAGNLGPITDYRFYVGSGTPAVGVWALGEGSGTTGADTAAPPPYVGHPLTLSGGASWTAGRLVGTNAATFNGTTAGAATAGPVVNTNQSFTVAAWVRLSNTAPWATAVAVQQNVHASGRCCSTSLTARGPSRRSPRMPITPHSCGPLAARRP
jgi:hypothetical protein